MSLNNLADKSSIMQVNIIYNGEKIKFNLNEELKIVESRMQNDLTNQPRVYAFLSTLHKKLIIQFEQLEAQKSKQYGKLFNNYKLSKTTKHYEAFKKPPSDDVCSNLVNTNSIFTELVERTLQAKHDMLILGSIVRSFEQRADLLQTISANIRKER